jgi:hypothetical protein
MRLVQELRFLGGRPRRRLWPAALIVLIGVGSIGPAVPAEPAFDDPLFRKCVSWMLDGRGGAMIENRCIADFAIPPPSIFSCARKVLTGFQSAADQEGCALIFEEQAKRARSGYVK